MRSEDIPMAVLALLISEFPGAVFAMVCSVYSTWRFDQEAGRRALRSGWRITGIARLFL